MNIVGKQTHQDGLPDIFDGASGLWGKKKTEF